MVRIQYAALNFKFHIMILNLLAQLFVHLVLAINIAIELPITLIIYVFTGKDTGILDGKAPAFLRIGERICDYLDKLIK